MQIDEMQASIIAFKLCGAQYYIPLQYISKHKAALVDQKLAITICNIKQTSSLFIFGCQNSH